jgi:arylsulfatase A-like enzyme
MSRKRSLLILVALQCLVAQAMSADDRPNFVLFISDDVSWNDHGCYGNAAARTPVIDQLAADGLRFDQAFLTASSCSPSRSSVITGRYPHNNGKAAELHQSISGNLAWFPAMLKKAGYYTVLSGKNHMSVGGVPDGATPSKFSQQHV